jgi:signal transduction histidine kinase
MRRSFLTAAPTCRQYAASVDLAVRLARAVAVTVSVGFAFGGYVGIIDADHPGPTRLAAAALLTALLGLHLRNCVRRADGRRPRAWPWTLAAQAVLTAAGMVWFADTWYGNSGFLAAAILLLIRPPALAWAGFGAVLVAQFCSALPVRHTVGEALYLALGHAAFVGVALYVVARLADLVTDLRATRTALADAAVARERLAFAEELNERVGAGLEAVVRDGSAALDAGPAASGDRLRASLETARSALNDARSVAHGHHRDPGPGVRLPALADDLTVRGVTAVGIATLVLMIVPSEVRRAMRVDLAGGELALFAGALTAYVAAFLFCCVPWTTRPRPAPGALGALGALGAVAVPAVAPLATFDLGLWHVVYFLPGVTLVVLRGPARWIVTLPLVCLDALLSVWGLQLGDPTVLGEAYEIVWSGERALTVYGLARMAEVTVRLRNARAELARAEVGRERLRFARDLHDLLGYSLSVVVLKSELAHRLVGRDPARARAELADGLDAARRTLAEMRAVAAGYTHSSLVAQIDGVRADLTAAGVSVRGTVAPVELPPEAESVLAIVVREGVTNVLRHTRATWCSIDLAATGGTVTLTLVNDGAATATAPSGVGLMNLTTRLEAVGGSLRTGRSAGTFGLVATLPATLQPAALGRDADRVDAVAGVELGEGGREVVADGPAAQR